MEGWGERSAPGITKLEVKGQGERMAHGIESSKGDEGRSRGGLMIFVWLDCEERQRGVGMRRSGPCESRGRGIEEILQAEVCLRNSGADKKLSQA